MYGGVRDEEGPPVIALCHVNNVQLPLFLDLSGIHGIHGEGGHSRGRRSTLKL